MGQFGYIGNTAPAQSETSGNKGVFSIEEQQDLLSDSKWAKTGPVIEYVLIAGGGGGRSGKSISR